MRRRGRVCSPQVRVRGSPQEQNQAGGEAIGSRVCLRAAGSSPHIISERRSAEGDPHSRKGQEVAVRVREREGWQARTGTGRASWLVSDVPARREVIAPRAIRLELVDVIAGAD